MPLPFTSLVSRRRTKNPIESPQLNGGPLAVAATLSHTSFIPLSPSSTLFTSAKRRSSAPIIRLPSPLALPDVAEGSFLSVDDLPATPATPTMPRTTTTPPTLLSTDKTKNRKKRASGFFGLSGIRAANLSRSTMSKFGGSMINLSSFLSSSSTTRATETPIYDAFSCSPLHLSTSSTSDEACADADAITSMPPKHGGGQPGRPATEPPAHLIARATSIARERKHMSLPLAPAGKAMMMCVHQPSACDPIGERKAMRRARHASYTEAETHTSSPPSEALGLKAPSAYSFGVETSYLGTTGSYHVPIASCTTFSRPPPYYPPAPRSESTPKSRTTTSPSTQRAVARAKPQRHRHWESSPDINKALPDAPEEEEFMAPKQLLERTAAAAAHETRQAKKHRRVARTIDFPLYPPSAGIEAAYPSNRPFSRGIAHGRPVVPALAQHNFKYHLQTQSRTFSSAGAPPSPVSPISFSPVSSVASEISVWSDSSDEDSRHKMHRPFRSRKKARTQNYVIELGDQLGVEGAAVHLGVLSDRFVLTLDES